MQCQHRAGQGFAVLVFRLQGRDVCKKDVALDGDAQAVDTCLVRSHQLRQVEILGVARQAHARHLIHANPEQLRCGTVGRDDGASHIDGQHRKFQRAEQRVEFKRMPLAGHQPDLADLEHALQRLDLRSQRLQLQVHQVGAMQVNGVTVLAPHFATRHGDAVGDQQFEHVTEDADAVLAVNLDTHARGLWRVVMSGAGFSADRR